MDAVGATHRRLPDCWSLVLLIAMGTLSVAFAYDLGRHHVRGATAFYWMGQALILLTPAWANLSRTTDTRSRIFTLVSTAAAQSLLAWCYSPDQFRNGDELQHVLTAQDILSTHSLYSTNPVLPISAQFPGLEIATTALTHLTGLSLFHAGVIVVSVCHAVLPVGVFLLFRELIGPPQRELISPPQGTTAPARRARIRDWLRRMPAAGATNPERAAGPMLAPGPEASARMPGIAALVYSLSPHYSYYDTLFVYGVPAITLLVLVLGAAVSSWRRKTNPLWIVAAFAPLAVTHHVSAFAAIAILLTIAIAIALSGSPRRGLFLVAITFLLVDDLIAWIDIQAPTTFAYLWDPIRSSFQIATTGKASGASSFQLVIAPEWEHYAAEASALVIVLLVMLGIVLTWRSSRDWFLRLLALLGVVYVAILGVRVRSSDGPELAARALSYAMLLTAWPVARALAWLWTGKAARLRDIVVLAVAPLLLVGAVVTGLPAAWERIPGRFQIASDEAGIDARVTDVSDWAASAFPPNQRVACDTSVCSMFGAYAKAIPSTSAAPLYYTKTVGALNRGLNELEIDDIEVDSRMTTQTPPTGGYFVNDPRIHPHPLPASLLTKFAQDPLLDRVYDDGDIRVYYAGRVA